MMREVSCAMFEHATRKGPAPSGGAITVWFSPKAAGASDAARDTARPRRNAIMGARAAIRVAGAAASVESGSNYGRHSQAPAHPAKFAHPRGRWAFGQLVPAELLRRQVHAGARLPRHPGEPHVRGGARRKVLQGAA